MAEHFKSVESSEVQVEMHQIRDLLKCLYGLNAKKVETLNGYCNKNYHVEVEESFDNAFIGDLCPHGYVLKVYTEMERERLDYFDAQCGLLQHLRDNFRLACPLYVKTMDGNLYTTAKLSADFAGEPGQSIECLIILLAYVPGDLLCDVKQYTYEIFYELGHILGELDVALEGFKDTRFDCPMKGSLAMWMWKNIPQLKEFIYAVQGPDRKQLVLEVVEKYIGDLLPVFPRLKKGLIHGDMNDQNVLTAPTENFNGRKSYKISGIIDFGEMQFAPYIFEIGIAICYSMICCKNLDILEVGGHVLSGYLRTVTLSDLELELLPLAVATRFAQSCIMGDYGYSITGDEYRISSSTRGWVVLEAFWKIPAEDVVKRWRSVVQRRLKENNNVLDD